MSELLTVVRDASRDARILAAHVRYLEELRDAAIIAAVRAGHSYSEVAMAAQVGKSSVHAIVSRLGDVEAR